jgi:hypothetical protein
MSTPSKLALKLSALFIALLGAVLFTIPAHAHKKGDVVVSEGLVCDRASEVDAVVTLSLYGQDIQSAISEINTGAEKPRCVVGVVILSEFVETVQTFYHRDSAYSVHKVRVVGIGLSTPIGIVPQRLESPVEQYVVSTAKAAGA